MSQEPINAFLGVLVQKADKGTPGDWLIVEDPKVPSSWHLRVRRNGKPDHNLMGEAFAALYSNFRGNSYAGPKKEEAKKKLTALYHSEKLPMPKKSEIMDKKDMEEMHEKNDNDAEEKAEKDKKKS